MARVANFRGQIITTRGEASRLGHGEWARVVLNTRDMGGFLRAQKLSEGGVAWEVSFSPVNQIGAHGASFGADCARVWITPEDMEALRTGRATLRVVPNAPDVKAGG